MAAKNTAERLNALLAGDDATIAQALRDLEAKAAPLTGDEKWQRRRLIDEIERRHPDAPVAVHSANATRDLSASAATYVADLLTAAGC